MCAEEEPQPNHDTPLIVTSNRERVIRARQSLYEALLQLERGGLEVVERGLHEVDIVLNPSTCVCIWTESQLSQVCTSSHLSWLA